jgi:hypothetical protein
MSRPSQPTPYSIAVDVHQSDEQHHEILVEPLSAAEDGPGYTLTEHVAGHRWVAGIAARAAVALAEEAQQLRPKAPLQ